MTDQSYRFSIAPMMDRTDRHCRYLMRLISRRARLYTEMITTGAVLNGDRARLLAFDPSEHPVALQLGGSEPARLAEAARIGEGLGYGEINLNVGCPSDRVRSGRFGACLMAEPDLVARCVETLKGAVRIPVTVKCRIGIDDQDSESALSAFAQTQTAAGADALIVHARKAWLEGLSPKENREVPPLDYGRVYRLKAELGGVPVVINGGIASLDEAHGHLAHLDGVMLGRAAYHSPFMLAGVDRAIFAEPEQPSRRHEIARAYSRYIETELGRGTSLHAMTRHLIGLFQGMPGARAWRRHLSEAARRPGAGPGVVEEALDLVGPQAGDATARYAA